jgi:hypothetical protein
MAAAPHWLDIVRHRARRIPAPHLLVLQHHDIPADTLVVAPVLLPLPGDRDVLAPLVTIGGVEHRLRMLVLSALPRTLLRDTVASAAGLSDVIMDAVNVILRGYPVVWRHPATPQWALPQRW